MPGTRKYNSSLRDQQAAMTRERVLEGLIRVIVSDGVGELSVPSVAAEAGVSVPTIYRHFGSKQGLVDALGEHVVSRSGLAVDLSSPPESVEGLVDLIADMYRKSAAMEPALRAAMATDVGQQARRRFMPERLKAIEQTLSYVAEGVPEPEFTLLRDTVLILGSSAVMRAFKDYLEMSAEEAAETVKWALRLIIEGLRANSHGSKGESNFGTPGVANDEDLER